MNLGNFWTVQYSPTQDAFHVGQLSDYFSETHNAFYNGLEHDWILLAIHPTREGASDECNVWKARRDTNPLNELDDSARLLRRLVLHFGQTVQARAGVELLDQPIRPDRTETE